MINLIISILYMISRLSCSLTIPNYKSRIVIFGSTGKTGKEVVNSLRSYPNISIVCVVKDLSRGRKLLGPDQPGFSVLPADLVYDKQSKLENIIQDANSVIYCAGNSQLSLTGPYQVDYLGTRKVIDACVNTGVNKFVMVSSILANGLAAGQALNPQYLLLNTFGGVLFWKYKAESYLQDQSNLKFTIIRPGGLSDKEPSSPILYGAADTLFGGSVTRRQVAQVAAEACFLSEADNKIVEIIATPLAEKISIQEGFMNV